MIEKERVDEEKINKTAQVIRDIINFNVS